MQEEISEGKLKDVLSNIVYVGIPPFPQIIKEEQWIKAAEKSIKEEGHEEFFYRLIRNLKATYDKVLTDVEAGKIKYKK